VQVTVPDEKLGRVGSVIDTTVTVSYLISMSAAAFLADAFGIRTVFVGAGIVTALSIIPALTMMKEPTTSSLRAPESMSQRSTEQLAEV
jgi:predicted MFS family arabinose efflux permease